MSVTRSRARAPPLIARPRIICAIAAPQLSLVLYMRIPTLGFDARLDAVYQNSSPFRVGACQVFVSLAPICIACRSCASAREVLLAARQNAMGWKELLQF